ncbi:MAG: flagellar type III secretion system pore protein FliP [Thermodesulfobacteriota bacterium]|nr:flagellar type III secretion system pore protein FliP [Thermodesulfobacteriota bacterium]
MNYRQSREVIVQEKKRYQFWAKAIFLGGFLVFVAGAMQAGAASMPFPSVNLGVSGTDDPDKIVVAMEILALLTVLSLAPAILMLTTSFTRLIIVFHFLRQALATRQTPPNQVLVGLSLFLTFFIMAPVWQAVYQDSIRPYIDEEITYKQAFENAKAPVRAFMIKNTRETDLALFISAAGAQRPNGRNDVTLLTLLPAFVLSEIKTAFIIGFVIYIPFLIIDMVTASILLSMGMMMLPPVMISLPFKLMLFVLVDGWTLMVGSLLRSFGV